MQGEEWGRGVTLLLTRGAADRAGASLAGPWLQQLSQVPGARRLALAGAVPIPDGLPDACATAGVELVEAPDQVPADDVVVLAHADDLPGPHAVARLAAAVADGVDVADARTLPVGLAWPSGPAGTALPPSGVAVAVDASTWQRLGGGEAAAVVERAASVGLVVATQAAATVLRAVRLSADGRPVDAAQPRREAPEVSGAPPSSGHPAALPATTMGALVVRLGLTAPAPDDTARPFLSIVTRTQGRRLQCLGEMLASLAAQTVHDFEVLLVCHRVPAESVAAVRAVVEEQPAWLQDRVRLLAVERPGRAAPLNDGFAAAAGRYVVALDDDDTVLDHWVETFRSLERQAPGRVLRCRAVRQDVVPVEAETAEGPALCAVPAGPPVAEWPEDFSLVDHLHANYSPFMTVAFPRGVVHDLGLRFDEELATTEDWEFLGRAAAVVGVVSDPELTCVYRWWTGEGSRSQHDEAEWERARAAVYRSFDSQTVLLPPGEAGRVIEALHERGLARNEALGLSHQVQALHEQLRVVTAERDELAARTGQLEARVAALKARNRQRRDQNQQRLELLREVHDLLVQAGNRSHTELVGDGSLFDLDRKQLRALARRLRRRADAPPPPRRGLLRRR